DFRTGESNRVLFNGSGVALGDYDNDGLPDIYFCSLNGNNALYKNLGGWRFKDVTRESGIVCSNQFCRGAVFADINGDGFLDLLMLRGKLMVPPPLTNRLVVVNGKVIEYGEPDILYLNDGQGHFTRVPWNEGAFLDEEGQKLGGPPLDWGLTASFRDLNGDGF